MPQKRIAPSARAVAGSDMRLFSRLFPCAALITCLSFIFCSLHAGETPPASSYIREITIDPQSSDTLYAASTGSGLFKSLDAGASWHHVNSPAMGEIFYAVKIAPDPVHRLFAGGKNSGLWVSTDEARSWNQVGLPGVTILSIALDPQHPARLFVLSPEGVYRTQHLGTDPWKLVFNYHDFLDKNRVKAWPEETWSFDRFQEIALSPHDPNLLFVAARWEGGYHRSNDGGETWTHETVSGIFRRVDLVRFHPTDPDILYAGTHHQGLFKSYNRGKSWVSLSHGLVPQIREPNYAVYLISGLTLSPDNPEVLYSGSDHSNWKSTDGGVSWHELGQTLSCEFTRSMTVNPRDATIVYAATNIGLYKSTDAGVTWNAINRGLPERHVIQTLDVTLGRETFRYAIVSGQPTLYRRALNQDTDWMPMSWLLYETARSVRYDESTQTLILTTDKGERRSRDGGFRWDVPGVAFMQHPSVTPPPLPAPPEKKPGFVILPVQISGAIAPNESLVDVLYRRPPYVSLQIVSEQYPLDRSVPAWSGNWDYTLGNYIQIPDTLLAPDKKYQLYIEVRDFQHNVLTGSVPLTAKSGHDPATPPLNVPVDRDHLLPSFRPKR